MAGGAPPSPRSWQTPPAQLSPASQAWQPEPPAGVLPHWASERWATQPPAESQQPAQVAGPHTAHVPLSQNWSAGQTAQAFPWTPQAWGVLERLTHPPSSPQQPAQFCGPQRVSTQWPATQLTAGSHAWQAFPLAPQAAGSAPPWHWP